MPDQDEPESSIIPGVMTPREFAQQTGWSERRLREIARRIGACRIVGNRMLLTQADIDAIFEEAKPKPRVQPTSGPTPIHNAYEKALALIAEGKRKRPRR